MIIKTNFVESKYTNIVLDSIIWTLYFDISNCKEGARVGSILMDLKGNKVLMMSHLEFACTKTTTEYKPLLQGLRKVVDLTVKHLNVYGDSNIVFK